MSLPMQTLCFLQLEIYEMIGQAISNSRRAGGEVRRGRWSYHITSNTHDGLSYNNSVSLKSPPEWP